MNLQYKGYIFDMDGVIINNHEYHFQAWINLSKKYNFELNEKIYREKFNGKTNKDLFEMIFGPLSDDEVNRYAIEKEQDYQNLYLKDMKPHDGLIDFLDLIKDNGYQIALGTSAPPMNVIFTLDTLNIRHYFDVIIDGSQVTKGKPNPEVYQKCVTGLNLLPQDCVVFEDALLGLEAGRAAGCDIIGVATTHKKEELLIKTSKIIENFTELII